MCQPPLFLLKSMQTIPTHESLSIHNNAHGSCTTSLIWAFVLLNNMQQKHFEQFLNLNCRQEVVLYLFPVPVLFLPGDLLLKIVHPDNGAAVGIVTLF